MNQIINIKKLGPTTWAHLDVAEGHNCDIIVAGYVDTYETGGENSDKGIWYKFKGEFEAQFDDVEGKEVTVRSVVLFLPDLAAFRLKGAVDNAKAENDKARVEFAVQLGKRKVPASQSPCGWEWTYQPVVSFGEQRSLIETIKAKALEAAKVEEEEPEKEAVAKEPAKKKPTKKA